MGQPTQPRRIWRLCLQSITVERVRTDNGPSHRNRSFNSTTPSSIASEPSTRPYRPAPTSRSSATNHAPGRVGLRRPWSSDGQRTRGLTPRQPTVVRGDSPKPQGGPNQGLRVHPRPGRVSRGRRSRLPGWLPSQCWEAPPSRSGPSDLLHRVGGGPKESDRNLTATPPPVGPGIAGGPR